MSMTFKGNEESMRHHLLGFLHMVEHYKEQEPDKSTYDIAVAYIKDQVDMENGMDQYYQYILSVERYNERILKAVNSTRGKTFLKHLVAYIKDAQPVNYAAWEIVREPEGDLQKVTEYGRAIRQEWVQSWAVGTEGDSFEGVICVPLKPGRYLKFHFSM